jgi:ssDNA-binding Zn-finger/Zn-ribbon topoisomerase 1
MTNIIFDKLVKLYGDLVRQNKVCPLCNGGYLILRVIPGKSFIGCTNFPTTGCKFTKKRWEYISEEELIYFQKLKETE